MRRQGPASDRLRERLYADLADGWVRTACVEHVITVPATDAAAQATLARLGFGQHVVDLVAGLSPIDTGAMPPGVSVRRATSPDAVAVADLEAAMRRHLQASPIFLRTGPAPRARGRPPAARGPGVGHVPRGARWAPGRLPAHRAMRDRRGHGRARPEHRQRHGRLHPPRAARHGHRLAPARRGRGLGARRGLSPLGGGPRDPPTGRRAGSGPGTRCRPRSRWPAACRRAPLPDRAPGPPPSAGWYPPGRWRSWA